MVGKRGILRDFERKMDNLERKMTKNLGFWVKNVIKRRILIEKKKILGEK
jgi:hypothetical protein